MQQTLKQSVTFNGRGLHSGKPVRMIVRPAAAEFGVWFKRTDVTDVDAMVPALWNSAVHTPLCTRLVNDDDVTVSTVEHVMAALAGCGISNVLIELDGPEVPIMDGSALVFVKSFLACGVMEQSAPLRAVKVVNPVEVRVGDSVARLTPNDHLEMRFEIDFVDQAIGQQAKEMSLANGAFVHHLCDSRTFCRQADVQTMQSQGLALGGTMENAIVVDGDLVLSPGGLRHDDEPVRHKMLDALGDLALAGLPVIGLYFGHKAGHTLTNKLLRALMSDPTNFEIVECDASQAASLPGAGVSRADLAPYL